MLSHSFFALFAASAAISLTFFASIIQAAPISGQGTWQTTLKNRDLNGDGIVDAFYDTALNISWLANANVNGRMNWGAAMSWATNLNIYGAVGWRLPTVNDTGAPGCVGLGLSGTDCGWNVQTSTGNTVNSELAHLYYVTLGNLAFYNQNVQVQLGSGLTNTANFTNFQRFVYWSGTEYAPDNSIAWLFYTSDGNNAGIQNAFVKDDAKVYAIAVRSGDVGSVAVPVAPTVVLVLPFLGLLNLRKNPIRAFLRSAKNYLTKKPL
jgi:hypothetical protein